MFRNSIAVAIGTCILGISMAANAVPLVLPVVQATANLTGVIQTVKNETGKQAGSPQAFPVPVSKSVSLNTNALVNLAQGLPIDAAPVKNVTLGYSCGDGNLVVVTKIPGAPLQGVSGPATLIDNPPTTHYIPVSGVIAEPSNGVTNPGGISRDSVFDNLLYTPTGTNPTSFLENKNQLGLLEIPAPAFGVPSAGTAPTGIQPLIGAGKITFYTGDNNKAPPIAAECFGKKSITITSMQGAIVAKPDGVTTTLIVITGGSLSVGNTLLGYH